MGDEWLSLCESAIDEATQQGLDVYLYDEDGWPSGFGGGVIPELGDSYCMKSLRFRCDPLAEGEVPIAAYRKQDVHQYCRIPLEQRREGDLIAAYTIDRHYVDLLNRDVTAEFIAHVHEVYFQKLGKYFGDVVKGIFTDEPQLTMGAHHWSFELEAAFEKETGTSLLDQLWLLEIPGDNFRAFRYQFRKVVARLFTDNFTAQVADWCAEHRLLFTGHFAAEDSPFYQLSSNGGVMEQYAHMQMPGIDHLGNRITPTALVRQLTSVAKQMNKPRTLSETFGCSGWEVSFPELSHIWGWQAVQGINVACLHLAAYSIRGVRKRDYPACFSYQEPWYKETASLSAWIEQLGQLRSEGRCPTDVLVLHPLHGMWCEYSGEAVGSEAARQATQFRLCLDNLLDNQIDFDLGDENLLHTHGRVENGRLCLGECRYSTVILPDTFSLDESTYRLLLEFYTGGGRIVATNRIPHLVEGLEKSPVTEFVTLPIPVIQNRCDNWRKYFQSLCLQRPVTVWNTSHTALAKDLAVQVVRLENTTRALVYNRSAESSARHLLMEFPGACEVARRDVSSLETEPLHTEAGDNKTYCPITLSPMETLVLEWAPLTRHSERCVRYRPTQKQWLREFTAEPLSPNALTVDYACYAVNDEAFSEPMPMVRINRCLYQRCRTHEALRVRIRYVFTCRELPLGSVILALEDACLDGLSINGTHLSSPTGWVIDRDIHTYSVEAFLRRGENRVELCYTLKNTLRLADVTGMFETERNRFFYPIEAESIYLFGDFDVVYQGDIQKRVNHYRLSGGDFALTAPTPLRYGDVTAQNHWFYRGNVDFSTYVEWDGADDKVVLAVDDFEATTLSVQVNGSDFHTFAAVPYRMDITPLLQVGSNRIVIRMHGSNRNLLGPHHHIAGRNRFVGPSTFKGEWGWEDVFTPEITQDSTWTDDYYVLPFEMKNVTITKYRKDELEYGD